MPVGLDENAEPVDADVWTGTTPDGVVTTRTCEGWTTSSGQGSYGATDMADSTWVQGGWHFCRVGWRLYCLRA